MTDQTPIPRPDGRTNRQFLLARQAARKQQVAQVGTGNQQNKKGNAGEDRQRGPNWGNRLGMKRGDSNTPVFVLGILAFKLPRDGSTDYIKRLIGLPGDKIQMIHGRLYINGAMVERTALPPYSTPGHFGRPVDVAHYEETLPGGVKHEIIELDGDDGYYDNTAVYEVPPGNYFMMGDNRDNSTDSRVQSAVGYVPFENIVGRAQMIFFSIAEGEHAWMFWRWPTAVRWNRIFSIVR